jgi:hypothetical protein
MAIGTYNRLVEDNASIIGTILNDWKPVSEGQYGYKNKVYS